MLCPDIAKKATAWLCCLCLIISTTGPVYAQASKLNIDIGAPKIAHAAAQRAGLGGENQTISAVITDQGGVQSATVFHRNNSNHVFSPTRMTLGENNNWIATIPSQLNDTLIEYYIVAIDVAGNRVRKGSAVNPLRLNLIPAEGTVPASPPAAGTATVPPPAPAPASSTDLPRWALIGLGILAAGLLAGAAGGSGGGGNDDPPQSSCCTITFTAPDSITGN